MEAKEEMITVTMNGDTFDINRAVFHFIELLKYSDRDVSDISSIINKYQSFMDYWKDFEMSEKDNGYENTHLQRFHLFHTIKPKTQYAHQQDFNNGKPVPYPVYRITEGTVYSMAPGGNYPLKECLIYVRVGKKLVPLK